MPTVSFVIATYARPNALRCTLQSLILQDYKDWNALVIGDCCSEETELALRNLGDSRISYYNLPVRFGEQSGPNSLGLSQASGEVVTFLNHDDLLVKDHISYGLDQMKRSSADFFIGKAANATQLLGSQPIVTDTLPRSTDLRRLLTPPLYAFDPSSFWLVKTDYARKVGYWRPATTISRTPLSNWLLRAWGLGGAFVFGDRITGIRLRTHYLRSEGDRYTDQSPEHEYIVRQLEATRPEDFRDLIREQMQHYGEPVNPDQPEWPMKLASWLYHTAKLDIISILLRIRGKGRKGALLRTISQQRTGDNLQRQPNIDSLVANAPSFRVF